MSIAWSSLLGSQFWLKHLLSPSMSWETWFGVLLLLFLIYILHQSYWITRSVDCLIERRVMNIAELELEKEQATATTV